MKKVLWTIFKILIGFTLIGILFYNIGFSRIYEVLSNVPASYIIIIFIFGILDIILAALNLMILLRPVAKKLKFRDLFRSYLCSWSLAFFVPGKIGEASLVYFLGDEVEPGKTATVFLLDKLITFIVLSLLSITGVFIFFGFNKALLLFLAAVLFSLSFLLLFLSKKVRSLMKILLGKYSILFKGFYKTFLDYLKNKKKYMLLDFMVTFIKAYGPALLIFIFLKYYFDQDVSFFYVFLITAMGILATIIPISANGLGVRELVVLLLYGIIGVDSALVLTAYSLFIVVNYLLVGVILLFVLPGLKKKKFFKDGSLNPSYETKVNK